MQFRHPGDYAKLLAYLGKEPGEEWTEREQRTFTAYFQYFREAFRSLGGDDLGLEPGGRPAALAPGLPLPGPGTAQCRRAEKALSRLWEDVVTLDQADPVQVRTEPGKDARGIFSRLISSTRTT